MISRQTLRTSRLCCTRSYATGTATPPPMLLKIRKDLKTAMQNKDTPRLAVLRSLLAQTLNASKTSSPINTDMQMLSLLRKATAQSKASSEEFMANGRSDLADKEEAQVKVLEEYAGGVETVGVEEVRGVVEGVVKGIEGDVKMGDVMKEVLGRFEGKNVVTSEVARVVKDVVAARGKA